MNSDILNINILVLAYLGDNVYEYYVRDYFIKKNISNVNDLQKETLKYVSAVNQSKYLHVLLDENFFSDEEINVIKRARNHKGGRNPKSCDIVTYKHATSLEALIGYLKLLNRENRIKEIMSRILGE